MKSKIIPIRLSILFFWVAQTTLFCQDFSSLSFGSDSTLDIATWNLQNFPKENHTATQVMEIIQALDLDIVAIQEISSSVAFMNMLQNQINWHGFTTEDSLLNLGFIYRASMFNEVTFHQIYENNARAFPRPPLVMQFDHLGSAYVIINNHFKCCGDERIDRTDPWDEEVRRLEASKLLQMEIEDHYPDQPVIVLGDLNDRLDDIPNQNVFQNFLDDPNSYRFVDWQIALGEPEQWSYPFWPSHIDHILITDELFKSMDHHASKVATLRIDTVFDDGFFEYHRNISDHLPVATSVKIESELTSQQLNKKASVTVQNFPNPFEVKTWIDLSNPPYGSNIHIYNMSGKRIKNITVHANKPILWDATIEPSGIYFAKVVSGKTIIGQSKMLKIR